MTATGSKKDISFVTDKLISFLGETGGLVNCTLKEEIITGFWISSDDIDLAPMINL